MSYASGEKLQVVPFSQFFTDFSLSDQQRKTCFCCHASLCLAHFTVLMTVHLHSKSLVTHLTINRCRVGREERMMKFWQARI